MDEQDVRHGPAAQQGQLTAVGYGRAITCTSDLSAYVRTIRTFKSEFG